MSIVRSNSMRSCTGQFASIIAAVLLLGGCATTAPGGNAEIQEIPRDDRLLANLTYSRGSLTYTSKATKGGSAVAEDSTLTGMIAFRDPRSLESLGGPYYTDGVGNLIRLGQFTSPENGGNGQFAIAYARNGGRQLAIDFRSDRVVDLVVDITPDGVIGSIGDADLPGIMACVRSRLADGSSIDIAMRACVPGAKPVGGGGSSDGIGGLVSGDEGLRLAEPDCSSSGGGLNTSSTEQTVDEHRGWSNRRPVEWTDAQGRRHRMSLDRRSNEGGYDDDRRTIHEVYNPETGSRYHEREIRDHGPGGERNILVTHQTIRHADGRVERTESRSVNGRQQYRRNWTVHPDGTCTGDCPGTSSDAGADAGDADAGDSGAGDADADAGTDAGADADASQPGPNCEIDGTCPHTDPRCEAPANDIEGMWDCVARTGLSAMECLARHRDAIYATTNCQTIVGPSGQQILDCPRGTQSTFGDCMSAGGDVEQCLRQTFGEDPSGPGPGDDDLLSQFRGVGISDISYIDTTEIGALLLALCANGVEQLCRGPQGRF